MERGMLGLGGVANSGWDLISSLQAQQLANAGAAAGGIGAGPFAPGGPNGPAVAAAVPPLAPTPAGSIGQPSLSPDVLGFLIWNQSQQPAPSPATENTETTDTAASGATLTPLQSALFSNLDGNGDGAISKSEFEAAFGANGNTGAADALFNQIDANGDDSISPSEFAAATQGSGPHGHHHHHMDAGGQGRSGQSDPLASLLGTSADGATTSTATNADGSTTTITYADGSEVTLTTPVQASSAGPTPAAGAAQAAAPAPSANILETLIQLQAQLLAPSASA
jgi:hypothetical protein